MNGEKIWELQHGLASFYQVEADHVEVRMEPLTRNGSNEMKMADFAGAWAGNSDSYAPLWAEDE